MVTNFLSIAKNMLLPMKKQIIPEPEKEIIYRKNQKTIHKIIEYDYNHVIRKITVFDYFKPQKVKSIEEYKNGSLYKITNFSLIKSETEYQPKTGKKIKTLNYNISNPSKLSSIYNYDSETQNINRLTIYRPDGLSVALIKEFNPRTNTLLKCINYKRNSSTIASVSTFEITETTTIKTTYTYNSKLNKVTFPIREKSRQPVGNTNNVPHDLPKHNIAKLIDNLYKNNLSLSIIKVS